ncbi:MAG: S-methyl-5-thioribose-1-phosphate isomerase [Candidatus Omnitrophica bacterium]|nr:S-methyl-5-thioribose-1-phosphate isomerase [Candidatus Omnitrophota bacterium]MCF7876755.1 S-methyl-5-thioribose-1-phosphate isomerase [Candidatus Omnitrophota bacterium]MCF7878205.1 S-methyl-5-thioribose-1-phosphate isomerase [Candidatus Omnitrophota bacterium]MCF7892671.1 S-methyl-5-thioribose-1-phosphate isomerase [Candidatus Omnitrophota bacterium]
MKSIKFKNKKLFYLDQTKLPGQEVWKSCKTIKSGWKAIKELRVRGAPLIGVFAAYSICVHLDKCSDKKAIFFNQFKKALDYLKSARPTAVNLFWALDRLDKAVSENKDKTVKQIKEIIIKEAKLIHREDISTCEKLADFGAALIKNNENILTHCNTGFLATSGQGTALGVIFKTKQQGKNPTVYIDETRPLLQGARLTAWELSKKKIKSFLITDNSAAFLMQNKMIDSIIVGADRIAASGDTANKIGTYNLAVLADYHNIPFYVAAPQSTFDLSLQKGEDIVIEKRDGVEVKKVLGGDFICPAETKALNFAFDLTPSGLITAIITDKGVIYPPYKKNIKRLIKW